MNMNTLLNDLEEKYVRCLQVNNDKKAEVVMTQMSHILDYMERKKRITQSNLTSVANLQAAIHDQIHNEYEKSNKHNK